MPQVNMHESNQRGPPIVNPGLSLWQQSTRAFPHLHANRDTLLPSTSPHVIIGSGISGALVAYELITNGVKAHDILILEAREAASGASSRNAGHVRPDAFRGFSHYSKHHGAEQAMEIIANERIVLERIKEFVGHHNVECDFSYTTTFDCCMTPEFAEYERRSFEAYREAGGDVSHVKFYQGDEARQKTGISGVIEAYEWPAGSIHPAKLAQWLLNSVISRGSQLFTHCPVTSVVNASPSSNPSGGKQLWDIQTPRGTVTTPCVIHCTNAFTGLLVPELSSYIVPFRGQAHAIIPPASLSADKIMNSTYSIRYSLQHFYSIIQRTGDGTIVLGCSRSNPLLPQDVIRGTATIDDTHYNDIIKDDALEHWNKFLPEARLDGSRSNVHGEGYVHAWNGIVGLTADEVPFLGPVGHGKEGQFLCAGFNGHGMARIFTCAPGVAKLVLGGTWEDTGLPECFRFSQGRAEKLAAKVTTKS